MREFFKGWKRKAGVMTLGLACMFAAGWVRSQMKYDFINIPCGGVCYRFGSRAGLMTLLRETPTTGVTFWASGDLSTVKQWFGPDGKFKRWENFDVEWRRDWGDFGIGAGTRKLGTGRIEAATFPYWSLTILLTLLSGWLVLSKPRSSKPLVPLEPDNA